MTKPRLFFDLETFGFGPGNMAPRPVVCCWDDGKRSGKLHMREPASWERIGDWIVEAASGRLVLVGHHVAYDFACLFAHAPDVLDWGRAIFGAYEADGVECTEVRQKLMDIEASCYREFRHTADGRIERISYHLADLVRRHLGRELAKPQDVRTSFGELYEMPLAHWPARHLEYAGKDVEETRNVWRFQEDTVAEGVLADQYRQARASFWLQLCANWGPVCDRGAVDRLEASANRRCMELGSKLRGYGLVRPNGSRVLKAAQLRMEEACRRDGIEIPLTDTGVCVDEDACALVNDEALKAWSLYSKAQNILSKDIPMLRLGVGRPIHTYYESLVETGRTSSSRPNIQNVKRSGGFRECFVPRPGTVYAAADYGKAELHSLAELCFQIFGHSAMGDALRAGVDPHIKYAQALLSREDVSGEDRQKAKAANFGFPGGLGIDKFRKFALTDYGVNFTEAEARHAKDVWFETWPEVREYLDWIGRAVGQGTGTITQLFSGRMRGGCGYTDGANTGFQGLTADYAKAAGWNIARAQYIEPASVLYGSRMTKFIHDEFVSEVPEDPEWADAAAKEQAKIMEESAEPWTPHCPVHAEPLLSACWSKKAKPVKDPDGRLLVWRPT